MPPCLRLRDALPVLLLVGASLALAWWQSQTEPTLAEPPVPDGGGAPAPPPAPAAPEREGEGEGAGLGRDGSGNGTAALGGVLLHGANRSCAGVSSDASVLWAQTGPCQWQVVPLGWLAVPDIMLLGRRGSKQVRLAHQARGMALRDSLCKFAFRRRTLDLGGDLDLLLSPHTPDPAAEGAPHRPAAVVFPPVAPAVRWCGPRNEFINCRSCGYSCNLFGFMYAWERKLSAWGFPYPARKGPVQVACRGHLRDPKHRKGGKKCKVRCGYKLGPQFSDGGQGFRRQWLEIGAEGNQESVMTATRLGYAVTQKHNVTASDCYRIVQAPAIFYGTMEWPVLPRTNFAHWTHDAFFPLFMNIYNALGPGVLPARPGENTSYVVVVKESEFASYAAAGLGWLLEALAPWRLEPHRGLCFTRAYFDCPIVNWMGPVGPLQNWLQGLGMSFAPLPVAPAPRLVLMVRHEGGTRYLENWEELADSARRLGWDVRTPLRPQAKLNVVSRALLWELAPLLQGAHCVVGFHGAELALMPLMPNGSVVVEICPREYRYLDTWYLDQAEAHGLHLLRWAPPNASATYGQGPKEDQWSAGWWRSRKSSWRLPHREWALVLRAARELIGRRG
eukprot:TRINITY_DN2354_c2_g2_i1.p1 TRINITY_DN2354_c2_g2~~TRINITY_DN2354_c2_g2_i1.p1  ORF type:complete len:617 (+),score=182.13 TRINITY_DN2354_c2_g2_i1:136-1986(+)